MGLYNQGMYWLAKKYIVREFDKWKDFSKDNTFWKSDIDWCTSHL